jgi:hypothetical protein
MGDWHFIVGKLVQKRCTAQKIALFFFYLSQFHSANITRRSASKMRMDPVIYRIWVDSRTSERQTFHKPRATLFQTSRGIAVLSSSGSVIQYKNPSLFTIRDLKPLMFQYTTNNLVNIQNSTNVRRVHWSMYDPSFN